MDFSDFLSWQPSGLDELRRQGNRAKKAISRNESKKNNFREMDKQNITSNADNQNITGNADNQNISNVDNQNISNVDNQNSTNDTKSEYIRDNNFVYSPSELGCKTNSSGSQENSDSKLSWAESDNLESPNLLDLSKLEFNDQSILLGMIASEIFGPPKSKRRAR